MCVYSGYDVQKKFGTPKKLYTPSLNAILPNVDACLNSHKPHNDFRTHMVERSTYLVRSILRRVAYRIVLQYRKFTLIIIIIIIQKYFSL